MPVMRSPSGKHVMALPRMLDYWVISLSDFWKEQEKLHGPKSIEGLKNQKTEEKGPGS